MTRTLLFLLLLAWLPACLTFREVPVTRMGKDLDRGDLVRVTDHDDARTLFQVTAVDEGVLMGADIRFRDEDIKKVEVEGYHGMSDFGGLLQLVVACAMVAGSIAAL